MKNRLGVGCIIYLSECDKESGNFMYAKNTHKEIFMKGGALAKYEAYEKKNILDKMVHLPGKTGDIIIFDDRGWHGPNQPSKNHRTVLELDFTNSKHLGRWQATDIQLPISLLNILNEKQLRILGKGSKQLYNQYQYKILRFYNNPFFNFQSWIVNNSFILDHYKNLILYYTKKFKNLNKFF